MTHFICIRCGTQFDESDSPPARCPICEDERQYVGPNGQEWTSLADMRGTFRNVIRPIETGMWGIGTEPVFAIGQRAMLIATGAGNILWDCISLVDDETVREIFRLGGIAAIAVSHPHYYSSVVEWSRRFGNAPILLHGDDARWIMRADPSIELWSGESRDLFPGATLVRVGGHFPGSTVLHWAPGAGGRGTLHTGDSIYVAADKRWVSFMYSYPNLVPLAPGQVGRIVDAVRPYPFECLYGAWWDAVVRTNAKSAVEASARRYIEAMEGSKVEVPAGRIDAQAGE